MHRVQLAEQLRLRRRPREALKAIHGALAADPSSVPALVELAWIHLALGDVPSAGTAAGEALAIEPEDPDALYVKAAALGAAGQIEPALHALEQGLRVAPWAACFHSYHASLSLMQGNVESALESSRRAQELEPQDAYGSVVRVRVLRAAWREGEALAVAEAALAHHPEHADLLVHFGELRLEKHDAAAAGHAFRSALRLAPSMDRAKLGLIDALRARSAIYRRLSGFLRRSDRIKARCTTSRAKQVFLVYVLCAMALYGATESDVLGMVLLLPVAIGFYAAVLWFFLYVVVRFVVPFFLVPVLFDSLGHVAIRDLVARWWRGSGRRGSQIVGIGCLFVGAQIWPALWFVLAFGLPFLASRSLPHGRARPWGHALALLAGGLASLAVWRARSAGFDRTVELSTAGAAAAFTVLAVFLIAQRRRGARAES